ncbi:metallophosphoesterase family protein [Roseomonas marmotae]|uniref:Serine/threonine protein phosphatase n=1 Tax=Roseomonas marmotae TaxID=2768161 RepID=A0ABS3KGM6_9PROT|nr:metallophosphoesterase family protein [Roseomonas marmotae]MBO1075783.1 serine/threonine protein phosphatase [Roseomonas marmotae]QTI80508.1 serine/threonine protein phosphatase [Roseomonas marmotae]
MSSLSLPCAAPGRLPPGLRVYAIGDVHGCAGQLARLHDLIAADWAAMPARKAAVVHLGDYVDRGPDSPGVLRRIAGPAPIPGAESVALRGNHEAMMLDALAPSASPEARALWQINGGRATLAAYGGTVPDRDLEILRGLALSWRAGDYLFVHAGIVPGKPLDEQAEMDLLWIREPFLSWTGPLGMVVVHGHTPVPAPVIRPNRIGIDTGAVGGGPLTCLVLEDDRLRFLQAR